MGNNILLESYLQEKEKETTDKVRQWAHVLRLHYEACIAEGFTPNQAMRLVERLWIQADEREIRKGDK